MMRSMSVAIAALRNHQIYMDVIASNISNINTTGFKASRVSFLELLNQTLRGSNAPRDELGGLNPVQIGLGMTLGGVNTVFTQGSLQDTGKLTDLAIQGDGFFVLNTGEGMLYTRDGSIDIGLDGSLLNVATGMKVMGWRANAAGQIDLTEPLGEIQIPFGNAMAQATRNLTLRGNLNADTNVGEVFNATLGVYDSLGVFHNVTLTFTKSDINEWTLSVSETDPDISAIALTDTTVTFDGNGAYNATNPAIALNITYTNGAASPSQINLNMANITQLMGLHSVSPANQDGLPPGALSTFNVSSTGEIIGVYSNGLNSRLGQIAIAKFLNPAGLLKMGQSLFAPSANSGNAQVGLPGQDGRGQISAGYLEMANVELAQQFTNMIVAQRGFQANSRMISASDELLQDLVNLKR